METTRGEFTLDFPRILDSNTAPENLGAFKQQKENVAIVEKD